MICNIFFFWCMCLKLCSKTYGLPRWLRQERILRNAGDPGSTPRSGRSAGEGNGYPFQYSCLESSTDRSGLQFTGLQRVTGLQRLRLRHTHWDIFLTTCISLPKSYINWFLPFFFRAVPQSQLRDFFLGFSLQKDPQIKLQLTTLSSCVFL